jgi:hypothetical protein
VYDTQGGEACVHDAGGGRDGNTSLGSHSLGNASARACAKGEGPKGVRAAAAAGRGKCCQGGFASGVLFWRRTIWSSMEYRTEGGTDLEVSAVRGRREVGSGGAEARKGGRGGGRAAGAGLAPAASIPTSPTPPPAAPPSALTRGPSAGAPACPPSVSPPPVFCVSSVTGVCWLSTPHPPPVVGTTA